MNEHDEPMDWELEDEDVNAPVIVCAGCGATVYADGLNERYCLACEGELMWIAAGQPMPESEPLAVDWDEVPF
jgi:hypothetical protein